MNSQELRFWFYCNNCHSVMYEIACMKRKISDPEIIIKQFNKGDLEKILYLENVRLSMNCHEIQRDIYELIDIINLDTYDGLHEDYKEYMDLWKFHILK